MVGSFCHITEGPTYLMWSFLKVLGMSLLGCQKSGCFLIGL